MPDFSPQELASWTGGTWQPGPPPRVSGVSHDTRTLVEGALYVALKGARFDGHAFVGKAFAAGACAAVVAAGCAPRDASGPLLCVPDTGKALMDMAAGHRRRLSGTIAAVTGSAGKSTVKEMLAQILAQAGGTASTQGNWNNHVGLPLSLLGMETTDQYGVFEVGTSSPGEIEALCRVLAPDWGLVTNVGPVHIEFFQSVAAIAEEKAALVRSLPPTGGAVLDRDGTYFGTLCAGCACDVTTVSMCGDADYVCVDRDAAGGTFVVREGAGAGTVRLPLPVPGAHNVANALLAVAAARRLGSNWDGIEAAFRSYRHLPQRWAVEERLGMRIINDAYNASPLSMRAALATFAEDSAPGPKWLLLGGMLELGDRTQAEHRDLGAIVAGGSWAGLITVGDLGRDIAEGALQAGLPAGRIVQCSGLAEAARAVRDRATPGASLLVKASRGLRLDSVIDELRKEDTNG